MNTRSSKRLLYRNEVTQVARRNLEKSYKNAMSKFDKNPPNIEFDFSSSLQINSGVTHSSKHFTDSKSNSNPQILALNTSAPLNTNYRSVGNPSSPQNSRSHQNTESHQSYTSFHSSFGHNAKSNPSENISSNFRNSTNSIPRHQNNEIDDILTPHKYFPSYNRSTDNSPDVSGSPSKHSSKHTSYNEMSNFANFSRNYAHSLSPGSTNSQNQSSNQRKKSASPHFRRSPKDVENLGFSKLLTKESNDRSSRNSSLNEIFPNNERIHNERSNINMTTQSEWNKVNSGNSNRKNERNNSNETNSFSDDVNSYRNISIQHMISSIDINNYFDEDTHESTVIEQTRRKVISPIQKKQSNNELNSPSTNNYFDSTSNSKASGNTQSNFFNNENVENDFTNSQENSKNSNSLTNENKSIFQKCSSSEELTSQILEQEDSFSIERASSKSQSNLNITKKDNTNEYSNSSQNNSPKSSQQNSSIKLKGSSTSKTSGDSSKENLLDKNQQKADGDSYSQVIISSSKLSLSNVSEKEFNNNESNRSNTFSEELDMKFQNQNSGSFNNNQINKNSDEYNISSDEESSDEDNVPIEYSFENDQLQKDLDFLSHIEMTIQDNEEDNIPNEDDDTKISLLINEFQKSLSQD
ncbi:hypothetical protein TRFO_34615 [Tritrichomonas foetus]|uniref:Uncharacterized protein n=1 Tax=Tritrichomonas foetus TaxID=1144522 RepID=A0A1J4JNC2_9EUKA|nr:hypothetical protein TRFO_34615 [Tritrichomonas foetus]|eukprot:OHS99005.1 hypothetical protein TRFO_34615 [Tritrichomonas foetus]